MNVRVERLTTADLPAIVRTHCAAFPGSALSLLGAGAVRRYYDWQFRGPHDVHVLGARVDSELVGFCFAGVFRGATSGYLRKNWLYLGLKIALNPLCWNRRMLQRLGFGIHVMRHFVVSPAPAPAVRPSFGVLSIAVDPRVQGLGVGRALLTVCEEAARAEGFREITLNVLPENEQATRFYDRAGWSRVYTAGVWKGRMTKQIA